MTPETLQWVERLGGLGIVIMMLYGIYKLARYAIESLAVPLVGRTIKAFDGITENLGAIAGELKAMEIANTERHGETGARIEAAAKDTRHVVRGSLAPISVHLGLDAIENEKTPVGGIRQAR